MAYKMSTRRKIAIATWGSPKEGNIYGKLTLDATKSLMYIDYLKSNGHKKVTITHIVGKAIALALASAPYLNGRIVFGKYVAHDSVDIAFLVTIENGNNLAQYKICNINKKSVVEISKELFRSAEILRKGTDKNLKKSKFILKLLPTWIIRPLLSLIGYLTGILGIKINILGIDSFPFGSCLITSVGMMGLSEVFVPPTPFTHVPIYVVVTLIKKSPVVKDGNIVIRKEINLMVTVDHRFIDGYQGAKLVKIIQRLFNNPWELDGLKNAPWKLFNDKKC